MPGFAAEPWGNTFGKISGDVGVKVKPAKLPVSTPRSEYKTAPRTGAGYPGRVLAGNSMASVSV
jgi:hypothetical protein